MQPIRTCIMIKKIVYSFICSVFVIGLVSGISFGSYVSNDQKSVEGSSAEFSIKIVNLGEEKLDISISGESDEGDIRAPSSISLEPSEPTSNPSGELESDEEWFLLDDNKYVKAKTLPVIFVAQGQRNLVNHKFKVNLDAQRSSNSINQNGEEDYNTAQKVVQSRSYDFTVSTGSSASNSDGSRQSENSNTQESTNQDSAAGSALSSAARASSNFAQSARDFFGNNDDETDNKDVERTSEDQSEQESEQPDGFEDSSDNREESGSDSDDTEGSAQSSSITGQFIDQTTSNSSTATLLAGVLISITYLFTVIM